MWSEGEVVLRREVLNNGRCLDQARAIRREAARITAKLDAGHCRWDDDWAAWRPDVA
jgi:hypothetical protein